MHVCRRMMIPSMVIDLLPPAVILTYPVDPHATHVQLSSQSTAFPTASIKSTNYGPGLTYCQVSASMGCSACNIVGQL